MLLIGSVSFPGARLYYLEIITQCYFARLSLLLILANNESVSCRLVLTAVRSHLS
jgi:hypothetical protein